ncbi:MAG: phosphodiester glycosidase family protein [Candidatus Gracilibacteria bacterium]|nr:phosphodiester glycosidase family protein [Candidatus Gracilibacteria bacterium]MDQ7023169.1 phosphodiester glycosidase family protein [Candidatus Gracilibacteria bacterium]
MGTVNGITGINGVFECPKDYSACGGKNYTINERYVNGEKRATYKSTGDRVVFGWDKEIKPFLFQTDKINKDRENDIWEGFANHPLLLKDGIPQTKFYHELGLIDYKMKSKGTRNFICSNKSGEKIFFGLIYNTDIDNLAIILKDFGCYNAINLDAGYSTAFIYNGKYIIGPKREILDGVFIVPKNIDTKKIELQAKNIIKNILIKIEKSSNSKKIKSLKNLNIKLNSISTNIYKNNQTKVFEEKSGKRIQVGTKTKINNIKTIEQIYLINILREYTNGLIDIYSEIPEYKYIKKLDLKVKINTNIEIGE